MSEKDEVIEAYKRKLEADEAIDSKYRAAKEYETQRDVGIKWRNTFLPLFREAAAKENSDLQTRLPGRVVPQFRCQEEGNTEAVYSINRRWTEGTAMGFDAGTVLRFLLAHDGTITVSCPQLQQSVTGSMHLNTPSREWVQKVFEQVMVATVKDLTVH
jgi:hypothetical protein